MAQTIDLQNWQACRDFLIEEGEETFIAASEPFTSWLYNAPAGRCPEVQSRELCWNRFAKAPEFSPMPEWAMLFIDAVQSEIDAGVRMTCSEAAELLTQTVKRTT